MHSLRTVPYSAVPLSTIPVINHSAIPMSIGKNHRSNLPSDLPMMAKGGHETTNPSAVAFHNSLGRRQRQHHARVPTKSALPPIASRCQRA
jgi:hypothetical protein